MNKVITLAAIAAMWNVAIKAIEATTEPKPSLAPCIDQDNRQYYFHQNNYNSIPGEKHYSLPVPDFNIPDDNTLPPECISSSTVQEVSLNYKNAGC